VFVCVRIIQESDQRKDEDERVEKINRPNNKETRFSFCAEPRGRICGSPPYHLTTTPQAKGGAIMSCALCERGRERRSCLAADQAKGVHEKVADRGGGTQKPSNQTESHTTLLLRSPLRLPFRSLLPMPVPPFPFFTLSLLFFCFLQ
jgi:hypothetical protein